MSVLDKIKANSTIKESALLSESMFFTEKDMVPTEVPAINVALSGQLDGGLTPGLTMWAGPSKNFKTMFSLIMAKAYMDQHSDAAMLFYDSEFGTPGAYFDSLGIDKDRVYHAPLLDVEQLKFDIMQQLSGFKRGDKVIIVIDSIGNLASKKEIDDTMAGKSTADMTRAKQLKSLFRMVTPHLTMKDIPMVVVNHTYKTLEMFSKDVVGGGTGSYYSADNIFILGRQQDKKQGKELEGYHFIINVEKSRYVREKSKIPITVKFDGGLSRWTGLLDMALEAGVVVKPKQGWYAMVDPTTGEVQDKNWRLNDTNCADFWQPILEEGTFAEWIKSRYQISANELMVDEDEI